MDLDQVTVLHGRLAVRGRLDEAVGRVDLDVQHAGRGTGIGQDAAVGRDDQGVPTALRRAHRVAAAQEVRPRVQRAALPHAA